MASYNANGEEFNKMQEEALERLREMRKRSRTIVEAPHQTSAPPREQSAPARHNPMSAQPQMPSVQDIIKSIFGEGMKLDSDRLIILMLLYVLYKNKADIKLLAALGYILL